MKEIVKKFAEEMEKILDEKFDKYQNGWKDEEFYRLRLSLNDQLDNLVVYETNNIDYKKEKARAKRILTHIANYCLFIFTKIK